MKLERLHSKLRNKAFSYATKLNIHKPKKAEDFQMSEAEQGRLATEAKDGLRKTFFDHRGRRVYKWVHYLDAYESHFSRFRSTPVRMLEIGVLNGGSLELWREYFGAEATLFGVDLNPRCAANVSPPNHVRIGSQDDPAFLKSVVEEMGGVDVVLDDGSHIGRHQIASFRALFPLLSEGGLYAIEDLHTSYWPGDHEGGYGRGGTGVEFVKSLWDDMHAPYHNRGDRSGLGGVVGSLCLYDSIAFIEKQHRPPPANLTVG